MDWYTLLDSAMGRQMRRVRVVLRVEFMVVIVLFLFWFGLIVWEIVFCERKTDLGGQILGDKWRWRPAILHSSAINVP